MLPLIFRDFQSKEKALKKLRNKALDKNKDEFYFHMINSQVVDGRHYEKRKEEYTPEQLKLMKTQDLNYIEMKRKMEVEKINKLKATLHMINLPDDQPVEGPTHKHIIFTDKNEVPENRISKLEETDMSKARTKRQKKAYRELARREERLRQLTSLVEKIKGKKIDGKKRLPGERLK